MPRYLDFDKVDYLDNDVLVYGKRVYDIQQGKNFLLKTSRPSSMHTGSKTRTESTVPSAKKTPLSKFSLTRSTRRPIRGTEMSNSTKVSSARNAEQRWMRR